MGANTSMRFLILYLIILNFASGDELLVDYYKKLIEEKTTEALNSVPIQDASEFDTSNVDAISYGTFDFIIVGAGSAGAVIATRLTEEERFTVLLLEAGGHESDFSDIPGLYAYIEGPDFNWMYNSTPQEGVCHGMIDRECAYPRGKSLGGSSAINGLMYTRGNAYDYDRWAREGNAGWSFKEVLPYFKKSENSNVRGDAGYHGKGGYLNVEYHRPLSPQFYAFIEANQELGRKVVDYNGREQLGVAQPQANMLNGKRHSTGRAFLVHAASRANLKILTRSLALKVLIEPRAKKAYGVVFSHNGKILHAQARKEVIISAGVIGSPQLLMLSGVGPGDHLREMGIPVVQSLSVGSNLHDHATYFGLHVSTNYTEPAESLDQNIREYLDGYGMFTNAGGTQGLGFFQTKHASARGVPDIEILLVPSPIVKPITKKIFQYTDEAFAAGWGNTNPDSSFYLYVTLLHPTTRGTVRLKSNSPYAYPLIDPKSLTNAFDREVMYEGIQLALGMIATRAFEKLNASLVYNPQPQCKEFDYLSKEFWFCQMKSMTAHIFHAVGTCKMGRNPAEGAVVNRKLKVHGVENLRVADASVMPRIVSAHTNAPTIMIGEKISDMIKREWK